MSPIVLPTFNLTTYQADKNAYMIEYRIGAIAAVGGPNTYVGVNDVETEIDVVIHQLAGIVKLGFIRGESQIVVGTDRRFRVSLTEE